MLWRRKKERTYRASGYTMFVDGIKIHYLRAGEGRTVVFLHGGLLCADDFKDCVQIAARRGYTAIAFDRPGYGFSESGSKAWTPESQAALINEALKQLNIKKAILVAHSWSGTMALSYALQYSAETDGIVLVAAAMYKEGYPAEHGDWLSKIVTTPVIGQLLMQTLYRTVLGHSLAKNMVKATFAPEKAPPGYAEKTMALGFRPAHFLANRKDVLAFPSSAQKWSRSYRDVRMPVQILIGENDPFGVNDQALRVKGTIPHAEIHQLPHAGHMIPQLHPMEVLNAIERLSFGEKIITQSENIEGRK
ncbi:alpha/beta hydrolase [Bacillus sp. JCM 19041]|uniref:alpha/beta fold hydrolase n=1 Tax=Bacillus sp. JCM 19041 TaxID=1460637 RepID=UPI0006D08106